MECLLTTQTGQKTPPAPRVPGKENKLKMNKLKENKESSQRPSLPWTPKRRRENPAKGKGKRGRRDQLRPSCDGKDRLAPAQNSKKETCHPQHLPTHRNAEAYTKPSMTKHTLTRAHRGEARAGAHFYALGRQGYGVMPKSDTSASPHAQREGNARPGYGTDKPQLPPDRTVSSPHSPGTAHRKQGLSPAIGLVPARAGTFF